jgi:hypothetical protein
MLWASGCTSPWSQSGDRALEPTPAAGTAGAATFGTFPMDPVPASTAHPGVAAPDAGESSGADGGSPGGATSPADLSLDASSHPDAGDGTLDASACADVPCICSMMNQAACGSGDRMVCVDLLNDPRHCGGCQTACASSQMCVAGRCEWQRVEQVTSSSQQYSITMGGTIDGVMTRDPIGYGAWTQAFEANRFVRMKNVGSIPIENPWLRAVDQPDLRTQAGIVANAISPDMTDREKGLALLWQYISYRHHATTWESESASPAKVFNVYGYAICGDTELVLSSLMQIAGLSQVRFPGIQGHAIVEAWFDGRWNLLDGDTQGLYLLRDNHTIASNDDIVRDHDLVKRSHTYGVGYADSRSLSEFSASLFRYPGTGFTTPPPSTDTMNMTLRPGEALEWRWGPGPKYHGQEALSDWSDAAVTDIANGRWTYDVDFTSSTWTYSAYDPAMLGGLIADAQGVRSNGPSGQFVIRMQSPYVFVGGSVIVQGAGQIEISWDHATWTPLALANGTTASLDSFFPPTAPARYAYYLRVDVGQTPIASLSIQNDVQMAPLSLPGLHLGSNVFTYRDDTSAAHAMEITHNWVENRSDLPPSQIVSAIFPPNGGTVLGTRLQFQWQPPADPDGDSITDYEFILSDRPDVRWPLSSNFHKLVSRTADAGLAQITFGYSGLLNSDTTYYWRVRARDSKGAWGLWSPIFSFKTLTPHPPVNIRLQVDADGRGATLAWDPSGSGTAPVKYKVYGSDEKGFTASDNPYEVWLGDQNSTQLASPFPGNLVQVVTSTSLPVIGANLTAPGTNRTYYRVVAIDVNGIESGPSDFVEAPRPFIYTRPMATISVGQQYQYQAGTIASLGDLRSSTVGSNAYAASYWDIDQPSYSLTKGPAWLQIDPRAGLVTGIPPSAGTFDVEVTVQIGASITDVQAFTITVAP